MYTVYTIHRAPIGTHLKKSGRVLSDTTNSETTCCYILGHFVHWGPFYDIPLSENPNFARPPSANTKIDFSFQSQLGGAV